LDVASQGPRFFAALVNLLLLFLLLLLLLLFLLLLIADEVDPVIDKIMAAFLKITGHNITHC
jgi:hypothetical protein